MRSDNTATGAAAWEAVYRKTDEIVSRRVAGETIIVPVKGKLADMQRIFTLNAAAECIWGLLDGERSLKTVREEVLSRFDVDRERAGTDIGELIGELSDADLIRRVN